MLKSLLFALLLIATLGHAKPMQLFQSVNSDQAILLQQGDAKAFCPVCGMHLQMFYKTSHAATFDDATVKQYCSMHCLVEDLEINAHKAHVKSVEVVDLASLKFIDARTAHYVVGSRIEGTMTSKSKYAFATTSEARQFADANGGKMHTYAKAYQSALNDFESDRSAVAEKRARMAVKGKKIYNAVCDKTLVPHTHSTADAKAQILKNGACGTLDPKQLHALAIYISGPYAMMADESSDTINVPENAKCPVCGMFVSKYPKWAAEAVAAGHTHYFDGVKDMMKWCFLPASYGVKASDITAMNVSDYYSLEKIAAQKAFYAIGSDVYGPMGNELIPFKTRDAAESFAKEHRAAEIMSFEQITAETVSGLDN